MRDRCWGITVVVEILDMFSSFIMMVSLKRYILQIAMFHVDLLIFLI